MRSLARFFVFQLSQVRGLKAAWGRERGVPWPMLLLAIGEFLFSYCRWLLVLYLWPRASLPSEHKVVVVVLSYRRTPNIPFLVRAALRTTFVKKVIVSNSNSSIRIEDHVRTRDPRLELRNDKNGHGRRVVLAREAEGDLFLLIDDDTFLNQFQLRELTLRLIAEPSVPHGFTGWATLTERQRIRNVYFPLLIGRITCALLSIYYPGTIRQFWSEQARVEQLNCTYAINRGHLVRYFELCALMGIQDPWSITNGEDLILSFSGADRPVVHSLGYVPVCCSSWVSGISTFATNPHFGSERDSLVERLEKICALPPINSASSDS